MSTFDPHAYGPVLAPLLATDRRRALGAGTPDRAARGALDALTVEAAIAHSQLVDRDMAACCIAGVWLLHDFLDESHVISQNVDTPSGSFWHGIMHRREGDPSNAKYWFRRVGRHDVLDFLGQRAGELAAERGDAAAVEKLTPSGPFDPLAFVDLCQSVERGGSAKHHDLCLDIQQVEWELLFDYCYRAATGR
jgi:hypothetical protein